mmetsp:Transcript_8716/g.21877  ORF Transcript_8716/g.21877 Transcript_8716/m.21877 type:complete len:532 (+) Transcript_8716:98-1693(+)
MKERAKCSSHYPVVSIIAGFFLIIACDRFLVAALTSSSPSSQLPQFDRQQNDPHKILIPSSSSSSSLIISEGSLRDMEVSSTMATKPGSTPGFYNPKRRIGRDVVVLSVAQWLAAETKRRAAKDKVNNLKTGDSSSASSNWTTRPVRLLDATSATGIQGLRCMVESPILANAIMSKNGYEHPNMEDDNVQNAQNYIQQNIKDPPELQLVLNDLDPNAVEITRCNVHSVREQMMKHEVDSSSNYSNDVNTRDLMNINITQRVAQAIMHEEAFEVSVLDPFGSVQPFLDAALSRAPQGGLIEVCATDVGVLYGSRPSVVSRHYHANLSKRRPPCYRERGVRLLFAAIAQAAGRHDRGVEPVYGVSTEHFCLVSMRVFRGAKAADSTVRQVKSVRICRTCGDAGIGTELDCGCEPIDGAGNNADEEGPLWIGPLHDLDAVEQMAEIACLEEAKGFIAPETCDFLQKLKEEAAIQTMFHRRPGVAAEGRTPKLAQVMEELQRRNFKTARTHFCAKSLKSEASVKEFDAAVKAAIT